MIESASAILWASVAVILYTWIGYPGVLWVLSRFWRVDARSGVYTPSVSIIIAARNEGAKIGGRLENLLQQDYPAGLIEIIVGSDGSTDNTVEIVRSFADRGVRLYISEKPVGRATIHNHTTAMARGEVAVFTDADTVFARDFLRRIVEPFAEPLVGCVSGVLQFRNQSASGITQSRGCYWQFEYLLRALESRIGALAIASGACMAVRRSMFRPLGKPTYDIDFITPLDIIEQGGYALHLPLAIAEETLFDSVVGEFNAQVRMTARNLSGTLERWRAWLSVRRPFVLLSIFSHKLLRWVSPVFLLALLGTNLTLAYHGLYREILFAQGLFYGLACFGKMLPRACKRYRPLAVPLGFCVSNAAFLLGILRAAFGRQVAVYQSR